MVYRLSDCIVADAQLEKFLSELDEKKSTILDIKTSCSDRMMVSQVFYKEASSVARTTKPKTTKSKTDGGKA